MIEFLLFSYLPYSRGSQEVLFKRLKTRLRQECIAAEPTAPWDLKNQVMVNPYSLDYLCVLDFEATCEEPNPPDYIHEVIEFPVVLLNLKTLEVVSGDWGEGRGVMERVFCFFSLGIFFMTEGRDE